MSSSKKKFGHKKISKKTFRKNSVIVEEGEEFDDDPRQADLLHYHSAKIAEASKDMQFKTDWDRLLYFLGEITKIDPREYEPKSPFQQAQHLMWEAFGRPERVEKLRLAERALEIYSDCADAYVMFAEQKANTVDEKIRQYERAIEAGRKTISQVAEDEAESEVWKELAKKGLVRGLRGLAYALYGANRITEAVSVFEEMLSIEPNDDFVRYRFVPILVEGNFFQECDARLEQFHGDKSCSLLYSRALALFKQHGCCSAANMALQEAIRWNSLVAKYLIGELPQPPRIADEPMKPGGVGEAQLYVAGALRDWLTTEKALGWLYDFCPTKSKKSEKQKLAMSYAAQLTAKWAIAGAFN